MTFYIRFVLSLTILCWFALFPVFGQFGQPEWTNLVVNEVVIADTITAGCQIPVNVTINNPSDVYVNTSSYNLKYFVDVEEPDSPSSFLVEEIAIPIDAVVLAPGESITVQQYLPVQEPIFDFPEEGETIQKNVVIVWGGGIIYEPDNDNDDHVTKEIDVSTIDLVDASLPDVDTVEITGPIEVDNFVSMEDSFLEECYPFGEIEFAEIDLESEEYYIRGLSDEGDYIFWSLEGNFIKCNDTQELLGVLDDIPFQLELAIEEELFFLFEVDFVELLVLNERVYYNVVETQEEVSFLFDLNYRIVGSNGELEFYDIEALAVALAIAFGDDPELVETEVLDNGTIQINLSNGNSVVLDQAGNWLYVISLGSDMLESGSVESEDVPSELSEVVEENFPGVQAEFAFYNDLTCNVVFEAIIDGNTVYTYDSSLGETNEIALGLNGVNGLANEIYPNPSTGELIISGDLSDLKAFEIYDLQGRMVHLHQGALQAQYSLDHLEVGVYFLHLIGEQKTKILSWIKLWFTFWARKKIQFSIVWKEALGIIFDL